MASDVRPVASERVLTSDGAVLAMRRLPGDGPPVVLLHGLAVHSGMWDIPPIDGPGYRFRGLAWALADAGFDVWMPNFRGNGPREHFSEPPAGQRDWFIDHFILYDAPAIFDHVRRATGRRAFAAGCSMGAMVLGAYLQGATLALAPVGAAAPVAAAGVSSNDEPRASIDESDVSRAAAGPDVPAATTEIRIVSDTSLAAARQADLSGAVFITFPAALRWPRRLYDAEGRLNWPELAKEWSEGGFDNNYPFEAMARMGWVQALLTGVGKVPLDWLRAGRLDYDQSGVPRLIADGLRHVEKVLMKGALRVADAFTGAKNHKVEVFMHGRRHVIEAIKSGVLLQMGKSVRARAFVSALGAPDHAYSDHYNEVVLPTLIVAGARDRIAHAETTREAFFDVIRSRDKTFRTYDDMGHGEFSMAPIAAERVFPEIVSWLSERAQTGAQAPPSSGASSAPTEASPGTSAARTDAAGDHWTLFGAADQS